jgi:nucleotide-binding universal stress UspA family protein
MKILLAIDDSKFSEAALQLMIAQSRPQDTAVRVAHVVEPMEIIFPEGKWELRMSRDLEEVRKKKLDRAQELVAAAADTLRAKGFETVDTAVREGDVRAEVIDAAAEWHADLIVIGSHGRKGMDRFLLGSVSEFVARHARCSVEIVRLPASP